jgi:hypothetical protein
LAVQCFSAEAFVSDAPYLPPDQLPRERRYRAETRGYFGWFFRKAVLFGLLWVITNSIYAVFSRFVWLPIGTQEITYISGVLFGGLLIAMALRRAQRAKELAAKNTEASELIVAGKLDDAAKILEANCAVGLIAPQQHALSILLRAETYLRNGRTDQALSFYTSAYYSNWFSSKKLLPYFPRVLNGIALCYAIRGDLETAEQWRDHAHHQVLPQIAGILLPLDLLVGVRAGRFAVVVQDAEKAWVSAESQLTPAELNALRLLCAFSLNHINPNGVQDANIKKYLDAMQSPTAGEFDYLAVKWPELKAFLVEHALSA